MKTALSPNFQQHSHLQKRWGHLSPQPPLPPPIINIFWSVSLALRCTLSMNNGDVLLPVEAHHACQWARIKPGKREMKRTRVKVKRQKCSPCFWYHKWKANNSRGATASEQISSLEWHTVLSNSLVVKLKLVFRQAAHCCRYVYGNGPTATRCKSWCKVTMASFGTQMLACALRLPSLQTSHNNLQY